MSRFACFSRGYVGLSVATVGLLVGNSAYASEPLGVYTAASQVEMLPNDTTATEVVIHGAFMFLQVADGSYSAAECGYMYFKCPVGSEVMCRMQWQDIRNMGTGSTECAGYGSRNLMSAATVRTEGVAPTTPDTWDLGIGIVPGVYIGGQCAPAHALACSKPRFVDGGAGDLTSDAPGAVDMVMSLDVAPAADTGVAVDTAVSEDVAISTDAPAVEDDAQASHDATTDDNPTSGSDAGAGPGPGSADASMPPKKPSGGGCRLAGDSQQSGGIGLGLVALAVLLGIAVGRRAT